MSCVGFKSFYILPLIKAFFNKQVINRLPHACGRLVFKYHQWQNGIHYVSLEASKQMDNRIIALQNWAVKSSLLALISCCFL
jgi:hypothetical protein